MPPKQSATSSRGRGSSSTVGRPSKSNTAASKTKASSTSRARNQPPSYPDSPQVISDMSDLDPFAEDEQPQRRNGGGGERDTMDIDGEERPGQATAVDDDEDEDEDRKTIPPDLLTHVLQQFFEKDGTRVSRDANAAVAKYMDIFVREAIARTVVEKEKGFLEVEDLEKVAPQLLLDL